MPQSNCEQLHTMQYQDLQRRLHHCGRQASMRHALRRECLRRAQAWGRLANLAGGAILCCLALVLFCNSA